jgi:hypothetical protein
MMNPNARSNDPIADAIVNLFAEALSTAYDMGAADMPIDALGNLTIGSVRALGMILDVEVEDQKNQQAACN